MQTNRLTAKLAKAQQMQEPRVLVVDDDREFGLAMGDFLAALGCDVTHAANGAQARESLEIGPVDVAFVDFHLPDETGPELVRWALTKEKFAHAYCITGRPARANVVEAMRAGCTDVFAKPLDLEQLRHAIIGARHVVPRETDAWRARYAPDILGHDTRLADALATVRTVAPTNCNVLIHGATGTGKELVAQAIHRASGRQAQAFVPVNCAALPESLIESELFGHTRGAFTGAVGARKGRLLSAAGGTLFLDEIGDMPLAAQAKLLRVLQDGLVTPVGSDEPRHVDVRLVCATHKNLEEMVAKGTFRSDLYYRLCVIQIDLPSLAERGRDVLELAMFFIDKANREHGRNVTGLSSDAERLLLSYSWPGNLRELANAICRAVLIKGSGSLRASDLQLGATPSPGNHSMLAVPQYANGAHDELNLRAILGEVERTLIHKALDRTHGNRTEAAGLLGLNRTTLVEKLRKLG